MRLKKSRPFTINSLSRNKNEKFNASRVVCVHFGVREHMLCEMSTFSFHYEKHFLGCDLMIVGDSANSRLTAGETLKPLN